MKILSRTVRTVLVTGKRVETITFDESPDKFYIIENGVKTGPFDNNDWRFSETQLNKVCV